MSDQENDYNSDEEVSKDHSKLLQAVTKLDKGQRLPKAEKSEPTTKLSQFHLISSGSNKKQTNVNLTDVLKGNVALKHISRKLKSTEKSGLVLPKPLEKTAANRINRKVIYENTAKELQKWDATITKNRAASTLNFPLGKQSFSVPTTGEFVERFRVKSDLEKSLDALEPPKPIEKKKKDNFPLTLKEARERRLEAAKFKRQQSYLAAKAVRQNKIKSKKYHRLQKKAQIKKELKEFEQLQKTDPEAALEKFKQLEKIRAQERASLRHKASSSSKWAKNKLIRAKYDKKAQQDLAKSLAIGRELTEKVKVDDSDDDDKEIEYNIDDHVEEADKNNPYFKKSESEINAFVSEYRKFYDESNKLKESKKLTNNFTVPEVETLNEEETNEEEKKEQDKQDDSSIENHQVTKKKITKKVKNNNKKAKNIKTGTSDWSVDAFDDEKKADNSEPLNLDDLFDDLEIKMRKNVNKKIKTAKRKLKKSIELNDKDEDDGDNKKKVKLDNDYSDLSFKKTKLRPELDGLNETAGDEPEESSKKPADKMVSTNLSSKNNKKVEIDPTKFIKAKPKHIKTMLPDDVTGGDEGLDDSQDEDDDDEFKQRQHKLISEAFADDDVVGDFHREKQEQIKKSQPEEINTVLPGWGSWTGKNIKVSKRKQKRFILKFPVDKPRKDENKGDVIVFEGGNQRIRNHLVSDLPYPFESVADYEKSIRAPIGRLFVTENAHKKLTEPAIKTKMGQIIEPMTEDALLKKDKKIEGQLPKKTNSKNNNSKIEKKDFKKKFNNNSKNIIKKKFVKKNNTTNVVKKNNNNVKKN
ncbi:hypothetical protein HCN44_009627 [Aphidius gifuensis]|uniref:Uncharacterized protein n=1 Tax=Aphidius gifuensis TaxID=684658 RepID=A0A834Y6N4_APHGI|nr:U3 small nucleolar RNA-associated protein 14 homolog C [Aphidius gifuensis]KAF7998229.1 hypothetical protein HCN44_009627 [Aphidius gifuensis]